MYSKLLKRTVYTLKRKYPTSLTISQANTNLSTIDFDTGAVTYVRQTKSIRRAIALPEAISLLSQSGFSRLSGGIQENGRTVIIDKADTDGMTMNTDMKVVLDSKEWDVAKVVNHEDVIYELQLKEIEGSPND